MTETANPKKTVVVVDDSALALDMTRRALEDGGFEVLTASTMEELEGIIGTRRPDLLLLDVNMPEMYGDDVALVLKVVRKVAIPIWLFSNRDESELASRQAQGMADGFISKSQGMAAVVHRVREILGATA
jgi:DNA-binding response OmpR family regulator